MQIKKFIYSNKFSYRISRHAAFWAARLFIIALYQDVWSHWPISGMLANFGKSINNYLPYIIITEMPYCYFVNYILLPKFLSRNRYRAFILSFISFTVINTVIYMFYAYWHNNLKPSDINFHFFWNLPQDVWLQGAPICCCIFLTIKLYKTMYLKEAEKQMLVKANAEAELQLLKAQIHPHFLFNTLNNIYSFALNKSAQAKDILKRLEDILHYMIEECEQPLVPVKKEVKIIEGYFELERIRYGNSLDMQIEITGDYSNKVIAPLLMIPFVENSFKHGTSKILKEPWIKLFIQADKDVVHFSLTNSKPSDAIVNGKSGIGLSNVKKRLELLYPQNHLLTIESTTNTFTVNMQIPIEKVE